MKSRKEVEKYLKEKAKITKGKYSLVADLPPPFKGAGLYGGFSTEEEIIIFIMKYEGIEGVKKHERKT